MKHRETFRLGMDGVDAFQIVYFVCYWDWYEHAFEGFLAAAGHPLQQLLSQRMGIPVVHADMDYHHPLVLGDHVCAELELVHVGRRSCRFDVVFRKDDGTVTAQGHVVHAFATIGMGPAFAPRWLAELNEERAD